MLIIYIIKFSPVKRIIALFYKRELLCLLYHVMMQHEFNLQEDPHLAMLAPWSWTASLQNSEKCTSIVKLSSLQYVVIAAQAD